MKGCTNLNKHGVGGKKEGFTGIIILHCDWDMSWERYHDGV